MNLHNDQGAFSQILIGFIEGATNDIDRDYDGTRFIGFNPVSFYSVCNNMELAIQGRELRTDIEVIPLGINSTINSKITLQITIDELQGQLDNSDIEIMLEDKVLNIKHDLKTSSYSFELPMNGTFNDRFNLIIKESSVLNLDNFNLDDNLVLIHSENQLNVQTKDDILISSFAAFDYLGRTIIDIKPNKNEFTINTINFRNGTVLLINIVFMNNQSLSKKIILLQ